MTTPVQAITFHIDTSGPISQKKIDDFKGYMAAYSAMGMNTVTLDEGVPVDPSTGHIESSFTLGQPYGVAAVTPDYVGTFTDIAHSLGLSVIWKPQFLVDGTANNVNDWFTSKQFYPSGTGFSVETFLSDVQKFWGKWGAVAQAHNVQTVVLGTEQGNFASPQYDSFWSSIIISTRSVFGGKLTYAENHWSNLPNQPGVDFWGKLDFIGVDDYASIGNGTSSTPYATAYANVFDAKVETWNSGAHEDIPGVLYMLSQKYGKQVLFTEFGTFSQDGVMNDPAISSSTAQTNMQEQANYFKANMDVFENYGWVNGISVWDTENENCPPPQSSGFPAYFSQSLINTWEVYNKPAQQVITSEWAAGANPPPINAHSAHNADGSFAGTSTAPDVLVGGYQSDRFYGLGGAYQIYGGGGLDTAVYSEARNTFSISASSSGLSVRSITGQEGSGTLVDVPRLKFSDQVVAFDAGGDAGQAYRMYQAAFARTPDKDGVSYWVSQVDKGMSLHDLGQSFIGSGEFKTIYGASPTVDKLVTGFYTNVLGRAPDASGLAFWVGQVQSGLSTPDLLVSFSESSENKAHVAPAIQNGIELSLSYFA